MGEELKESKVYFKTSEKEDIQTDEDIKAILTHEQYSQNCFRLEDRQ